MKPFLSKRISQWLLPAVLILFILEVLLLPVVLEITYAGREDGPDHILTYTTNSLLWDSATGIDENGVAVIAACTLGASPTQIILFAQAANALLLPITGILLLIVANDASIMKKYKNSMWFNVLVAYFESGHGYNFDIFNASNDKIYHDAMTILEDA